VFQAFKHFGITRVEKPNGKSRIIKYEFLESGTLDVMWVYFMKILFGMVPQLN